MLKTVALTLVVGLLIGLLLGGRIPDLAGLRFRWLPLLYAALVTGLFPLFVEVPSYVGRLLLIAAYGMLALFLVAAALEHKGLIRIGLVVMTLGWLLNTLAISANGGMPLSLRAYANSGQTENVTAGEGGFFKIVIADRATRLRHLGDVIPLKLLHSVVSAGDILLSIGASITLVGGMRMGKRLAK